jgi:hypothetical protein
VSVADAAVSDRESRILGIIETARGKRAKFRDEHVTMAHGAGGKATQGMIEGLFVPAFASPGLDSMGDAGLFAVDGLELALTTDSFVVKPIVFPGGSIGDLAVNGTLNDLAVAGARPLALSLSLILEEGLAAEDLRREVAAMAAAASAAPPAWAGAIRAPACRPTRCARGTACCCPARSASTAPRSCWRAASSSWTRRSSPTRAASGRRRMRCWRPRARRFTACATPPAAAWPRC